MIKPYKTIIEIFDDKNGIYNVLSVIKFKPKNAVYIGSRRLKNKRVKNGIISCLRHLGIDTRCFFYDTDMMSVESVKAEINNVLAIYQEAAVDLTGGGEVAMVAVGMLAKEKQIPLFRYDRFSRCFRNIYNCPAAEKARIKTPFNINATLALAGGAMKSHGHIAIDNLKPETAEEIMTVFRIYAENYRQWHHTVSYLQHISKDLASNELSVSARGVIFGKERIMGADRKIMDSLAMGGIIQDYTNDNKGISFKFKNKLMRTCLTDIGSALELFVYTLATRSGHFDDVQISVVIDWDGRLYDKVNTLNEIDVMLTCGIVPFFISCKSGAPNVIALNEIKTLSDRFGGILSKPVLVTMYDVRERDRYFVKRAEDMGVTLIDRSDLVSENPLKRLF